MKILMVVTSHDRLGDSGRRTGFWLEELAAPYYVFTDAGVQVVLASPKGGQPPMDPESDAPAARTPETARFSADADALDALAHTRRLAEVMEEDFDALFYPGGHGPMWDLVEDADSIALIEKTHAAGRPVAAVCHGPAALRHAQGALREPLVRGRRVTAFSNSEEAAAGLIDVVPFRLEDALVEQGARYSRGPDWESHVVVDRHLVTGQNPASSVGAAQAVLALLRPR
ncbi:type 1 glutamine amidotransferase domain-containing protein [Pseudoxanthomonas mexicana]|uniref:type 1 glutamine amidotransferase domain-containing protein n=1 Tax=Pseudoxanthomonas mexicana TaxID=128785 RepID=UPI00398B5B55